jgi:hypothetical protein
MACRIVRDLRNLRAIMIFLLGYEACKIKNSTTWSPKIYSMNMR